MSLIDRENEKISLSRQSELADVSRSSIYYQPVIDEKEILIMNAIDEIYTKCPFYGSRRIQWELGENRKIHICREHVRRLMRQMGLVAIYPRRHWGFSQPDKYNKIYPYLLKDLKICHPDQVWGTDITYVRLENGFAYLVAILDWFSRFVVAWTLSSSLEINFCVENLNRALKINIPDIHNSDQGGHFTAQDYTNILAVNEIQISMDSRGRCMDNIFTERLWRTVKYENVYLKSYRDFSEAQTGLEIYFDFYDNERPHSALGNQTPARVYFKNKKS